MINNNGKNNRQRGGGEKGTNNRECYTRIIYSSRAEEVVRDRVTSQGF